MNILLQAHWDDSKQTEVVAVASFRAILHLELQLHRQNLSVARASRASVVQSVVVGVELLIGSCILPNYGIGSRHHPYASFKWMQRYKR